MIYRQVQPADCLKPYVRYFGLLENDNSLDQIKTFKIIADGCPGLIFQENPNCFLDKDKNKLPQLFVHGLTTKHSEKTTKGRYRNIGVYFQPNALKSVFGIDANELTNQFVELNAIVKSHVSELLLQESDVEKRIQILSRFLLQQLKLNSHKGHQKTSLAIEEMKADKNETSLAAIQSSLNLSERSLERIFNSNIGISPKLFLRINRFQVTLDYIRKQSSPFFTDVAYQHCYADQSHFIREFKEFAGATPKQYIRQANEQAINFPEWKF